MIHKKGKPVTIEVSDVKNFDENFLKGSWFLDVDLGKIFSERNQKNRQITSASTTLLLTILTKRIWKKFQSYTLSESRQKMKLQKKNMIVTKGGEC